MKTHIDRRGVLGGIAVLLGGCATRGGPGFYPLGNAAFTGAYGPLNDHGHEIPGLDLSKIDPSLLRQQVAFAGPYRPGTIVVNIGERRLYFVEPGGMAMRYAVGVGREEALNFRGSAVIGRKAEWPHWTPTADMMRRMPIYAHYAERAAGRHQQSAGRAGALSLPRRIRTPTSACTEPTSRTRSAQKVSSGCIRLFNHDIVDLYNRAPVGTPVVVLQEGEAMRAEAEPEAGGYYDPYGAEPSAYPGPSLYPGPSGPYHPGPYYYEPLW